MRRSGVSGEYSKQLENTRAGTPQKFCPITLSYMNANMLTTPDRIRTARQFQAETRKPAHRALQIPT